ncbi:MAG TPA: PAS domain-containing protein [Dongiaceae bacterium]|nr:PAS domain-containing protein [Dongiaceae bacterium]
MAEPALVQKITPLLRATIGMRAGIIAFGCMVILLIAGLTAYDAWNGYNRSLERASETSENLARALEQHTTQTIEVVDRTLLDIIDVTHAARRPPAFERPQPFDQAFTKSLQRLILDLPLIRRIAVLDKDGKLIQDSWSGDTRPVDLSHESYFVAPRDYASVGVHVSAPMLDPQLGKWTIALSRRINQANNSFGGVAVAFIDISYFQRFYDSLDIGRDGVIQLLKRDGSTLIREPFDPRAYEVSAEDMAALRHLIEWRRDGSAIAELPPDNDVRIMSYRSVQNRPIVVLVGLSRAEVLTQWKGDVRARALIALTIVLAVTLLTLLLLRSLARRDASDVALRESEQRLDLAVRGTSDGLWDWDIANGATWFSPRCRELLGFRSDEDFIDSDVDHARRIHPEDRERRRQALELHLAEGKPYDVEYRMRLRDGSYRWFRVRGEAFRNAAGEPSRMAGSISDIDAHRAAENALVEALESLRESEARLSSLIENVPGVIYRSAYDEGWTEMFINEGIADLTGYPATDFVAGGVRSYASVVHPDDRDGLAGTVQGAVKSHQPFTVEYRIMHKNGTIRWVWERGLAVYGEDNQVLYLDGCIFDITDRKQAEGDLRRAKDAAEAANEAKSQFLAHMSHELRTPLNAIIGFSEVMLSELLGPLGTPQYRTYAADIHQSGSHLLGVINDILDLSKIEAGRQELHEEECDIGEVVAETLRLIGNRAAAQSVKIEVNLQPNLPMLRADLRMIKQILLNLLSNAVKFTPAGGVVNLSAANAAGGGLCLIVRDTGIGIPTDQLGRVLEPFVQVEGAFSRKYAGTGLGLPLSKTFAELHGGTLEIVSTVDTGTTVTVTFPKERLNQRASAA